MVTRGLILVLICLHLSIAATNLFATTPAKAPLVIDLTPHPGGTLMMTIRATVRGHEGNFMFDTGCGISYISLGSRKQLVAKPWERSEWIHRTGQRLDMPRCDGVSFDIGG